MGRSSDERGFATAQLLPAVALSLLLLATFADLLVQRYGLAAVHTALDEAVAVGSLAGSDGARCAARGREALDAMLGGAYGDGVRMDCVRAGGQVVATAALRFPGWAPLVPDLVADLRVEAVAELR